MTSLTGGQIVDPRTGDRIAWRPAGPIADEWLFYHLHRTVGWTCLGVIGNRAHLLAQPPEDHTPFSRSCVDGRCPLRGWVYAIDGRVPDQRKFEPWLLGRLRAGFYQHIKYINVNNRHWSRTSVRAGRTFATSAYSRDDHLHLSVRPGYEYARSTILADWGYYRAHGRNIVRPAPVPRPRSNPAASPAHAAARRLPVTRRGATGRVVRIAQGMLAANGQRLFVDGRFGAMTEAAVRAFQRVERVPVDGIVGPTTWGRLMPTRPATVVRGMVADDVAVMAGLLTAWGYPVPIDRTADEQMITALKRYQVARRVPDSVVNGRGDGIGGAKTWLSLLTL
ncbi:peptidoglycan-binding protein [Pilimelia columellifera]|uniref:Peptidoglycan binding-like domain-containing protein n=1 Tax=Pilimelia columellifera subsp. columellifera TaxID=706583 RepID=A0ABP6AYS0_9ACTN